MPVVYLKDRNMRIRFPDGMASEEIDRIIREKIYQQAPSPAPTQSALADTASQWLRGEKEADIEKLAEEADKEQTKSLAQSMMGDYWEPDYGDRQYGNILDALYYGAHDVPRSMYQSAEAIMKYGKKLTGAEAFDTLAQAARNLQAKHPSPPAGFEFGGPEGSFERWFVESARTTPQLLSQLLAYFALGPTAAATTMGLQILGPTAKEAERLGADPSKALAIGLGNAAIQSYLENIGISKMLAPWKTQGGFGSGLKELTERFLTETGTETIQSPFDYLSGLLAKAETPQEATELLKRTNWYDVAKQALYEGSLMAPYALLGGGAGMAASVEGPQAKARRELLENLLKKYYGEEKTEQAVEPEPPPPPGAPPIPEPPQPRGPASRAEPLTEADLEKVTKHGEFLSSSAKTLPHTTVHGLAVKRNQVADVIKDLLTEEQYAALKAPETRLPEAKKILYDALSDAIGIDMQSAPYLGVNVENKLISSANYIAGALSTLDRRYDIRRNIRLASKIIEDARSKKDPIAHIDKTYGVGSPEIVFSAELAKTLLTDPVSVFRGFLFDYSRLMRNVEREYSGQELPDPVTIKSQALQLARKRFQKLPPPPPAPRKRTEPIQPTISPPRAAPSATPMPAPSYFAPVTPGGERPGPFFRPTISPMTPPPEAGPPEPPAGPPPPATPAKPEASPTVPPSPSPPVIVPEEAEPDREEIVLPEMVTPETVVAPQPEPEKIPEEPSKGPKAPDKKSEYEGRSGPSRKWTDTLAQDLALHGWSLKDLANTFIGSNLISTLIRDGVFDSSARKHIRHTMKGGLKPKGAAQLGRAIIYGLTGSGYLAKYLTDKRILKVGELLERLSGIYLHTRLGEYDLMPLIRNALIRIAQDDAGMKDEEKHQPSDHEQAIIRALLSDDSKRVASQLLKYTDFARQLYKTGSVENHPEIKTREDIVRNVFAEWYQEEPGQKPAPKKKAAAERAKKTEPEPEPPPVEPPSPTKKNRQYWKQLPSEEARRSILDLIKNTSWVFSHLSKIRGDTVLNNLISDGVFDENVRKKFIKDRFPSELTKTGRLQVGRVIIGSLFRSHFIAEHLPDSVIEKLGDFLPSLVSGEESLSGSLFDLIPTFKYALMRIAQDNAPSEMGLKYSPTDEEWAVINMLTTDAPAALSKVSKYIKMAKDIINNRFEFEHLNIHSRNDLLYYCFGNWYPSERRKTAGSVTEFWEKVKFKFPQATGLQLISTAFEDLGSNGIVTLVGKKFKTTEDFFRIAQLLRNPYFESVYYIIVRNREIVAYDVLSSGTPDASPVCPNADQDAFMQHIKKRMLDTKGTSIFVLHNHPAGRMESSTADNTFFRNIARKLIRGDNALSANQINFVIIDHLEAILSKYNDITDRLEENKYTLPEKGTTEDPLRKKFTRSTLIGEKINTSVELAALAKEIEDNARQFLEMDGIDEAALGEGVGFLLFVNNNLEIVSVAKVLGNYFGEQDYARLRREIALAGMSQGSSSCFYIHYGKLTQEARNNIRSLVNYHTITEALVNNEQMAPSYYQTGNQFVYAASKRPVLGSSASVGFYDYLILDSEMPPLIYGLRQPQRQFNAKRTATIVGAYLDWLRGRAGVDIELTKGHGPQVGHWLRNMSSILSQTTQGRAIYEAARDFKDSTIFRFKLWMSQYEDLTKDLSPEEKRAVLNLLDTKEEIQGDSKIEQTAAKIRDILRSVYLAFRTAKIPVGYREAYLQHIFQGRFWVKAKDTYSQKVGTIGEAVDLARKMVEEGHEDVKVMQDTFMPVDDFATALNQKSYGALIGRIQKALDEKAAVVLDDADIKDILRGVAKPKPPRRFFGNLLRREVNNPNFLKDLDAIMGIYFYGAARKIEQDKFLRRAQKQLESMPYEDNRLRKFVEQTFIPNVLGHPTLFEEAVADSIRRLMPGATGLDVRRWFSNLNIVQYVYDLGLSISSMIANATQYLINTYPVVGEKSAVAGYVKAIQSIRNSNMWSRVERAKITLSVSTMTGRPINPTQSLRDILNGFLFRKGIGGFADATLRGFSFVEILNRVSTFWAGIDYWEKNVGKNKLKPSEAALKVAPKTSSLYLESLTLEGMMNDPSKTKDEISKKFDELADLFAFELVEKTQFRVTRDNLPEVLHQLPVRLLAPYKSFLMNQLKYTVDTLGPKGVLDDPKKALRFVAITFALAGVKGNPLIYAMFLLLNEAMKGLFGIDLKRRLKRYGIERGLVGLTGADISSPLAVYLPTTAYELLGRYGQVADLALTLIVQRAKGEGGVFTERKLKTAVTPAAVKRVLEAIEILKTGHYTTPVTQTPVSIEGSPKVAAIKKAIGFMPIEVARALEQQREEKIEAKHYKDISTDLTERWTQALIKGDQEAMDNVVERVVRGIEESLSVMENPRATEDEQLKAITDFLFFLNWASTTQKFDNALARKLVPLQIERTRRLPKYMRPKAYFERLEEE